MRPRLKRRKGGIDWGISIRGRFGLDGPSREMEGVKDGSISGEEGGGEGDGSQEETMGWVC